MKDVNRAFVRPCLTHLGVLAGLAALSILPAVTPLYAQSPEIHAVVSAASYRPRVAPESLASVFGINLAVETVAATPIGGVYPITLGGVTVKVNGEPAQLLFVSPNQINLIVPGSVELGVASVVVERGATALSEGVGPAPASKSVAISRTAPGLFRIGGLRLDRGAVLNAVTFQLDPFGVWTADNWGDDKRTRLSLFGTGFRGGGAEETSVHVTDLLGRLLLLTLEYVGPAPNYPGLDQINAVLEEDWDGLGLVDLQVASGEEVSNPISVYLGPQDLLGRSSFPDYTIDTIAGTGQPGLEGYGHPAISSKLQSPAAVAIDRFHNLYVADADNHVVRRISTSGVISTFAGTGTVGSAGDGGPAAAAQLRRPVSLAFDQLGRLYIADADDHKVRRVDRNGVISTVAGTGIAGFSGDQGPASLAQLNTPAAVAITPANSLIIADSKNHRLRKVTGDALIVTIAGTGETGSAEEGDLALSAPFHGPNSLAIDGRGALFIADGLNYRVRRLGSDKRLWTIAGTGEEGNSGNGGPASDARIGPHVQIALDRFGRLFLSDTLSHVVRLVDFDGTIHNLAGTSQPGFSGDGGPAVAANLHQPMSLAVDPVMDVFTPVSMSHRVRMLHQDMHREGEPCGQIAAIVADPPVVVGGQTSTGTVRLNCPVAEDTVVGLHSAHPAVLPPASVVVPAGHMTVGFEIETVPVDETVSATIAGNAGGASATCILTVAPASVYQPPLSLELDAESVVGGNPIAAVAKLGYPAPAGGAVVWLEVDDAHATVVSSIVIPEGLTSLEFLIVTTPVAEITPVVLSGATGGAAASAPFDILPGGGPETGQIASLSLSPGVVWGGDPSTGTVTLSSPASGNGVLVLLSTSQASVSVPATMVIPAGAISETFPVTTTTVSEVIVAPIVAKSVNTVQASLRVDPGDGGPKEVVLLDLSLAPSTVTGGSTSTGAVTLAEPAPSGGALINLSSSGAQASVPESIVIPEGNSEGTFTISTSAVVGIQEVSITAQSANSISKPLTIEPDDGSPKEGTIIDLSLAPDTVDGGETSTGTVTLAEPAPDGGIVVSLSSNNSAAIVASSITIAAGAASKTFTVNTSAVASQTTATITASAANSVNAQLTIHPPCVESLDLDASLVPGGASVTGTVTLTAPAPAGGLPVELSSSDSGVDVPASVLVAAGQSSAEFTVSTAAVASAVMASIEASAGACSSGNASLTVNAPCVESIELDVSSTVGGGLVKATVTLTSEAPAGGAVVGLSGSESILSLPSTVTVGEGEVSASFDIPVTAVASLQEATVSAQFGDCLAQNVSLAVNPPVLEGLTIAPSQIRLLQEATGTYTLSGPAPAGGLVVSLDGSSHNIVQGLLEGVLNIVVPSTVTIPEGETSADFPVSTNLTGPIVNLLGNVDGSVEASLNGVTQQDGITILPLL